VRAAGGAGVGRCLRGSVLEGDCAAATARKLDGTRNFELLARSRRADANVAGVGQREHIAFRAAESSAKAPIVKAAICATSRLCIVVKSVVAVELFTKVSGRRSCSRGWIISLQRDQIGGGCWDDVDVTSEHWACKRSRADDLTDCIIPA